MADERARRLRKSMTPQEVKLRVHLRELRKVGFHFRRQAPRQGYILDFVCLRRRLIVELDGSGHGYHGQAVHDAERDSRLTEHGGFTVLRFWNSDVDRNLQGVLDSILAALQGRGSDGPADSKLPGPPPTAPPPLRGSGAVPPHPDWVRDWRPRQTTRASTFDGVLDQQRLRSLVDRGRTIGVEARRRVEVSIPHPIGVRGTARSAVGGGRRGRAELTRWTNMPFNPRIAMATARDTSHPEIGRVDGFAGQLGGAAGERHPALLEAIDAVGDRHRLDDVLLDDDQAGAVGLDRRQGGVDVANDDRREAETELVAEEQPRAGHQRAADGAHLLLAAGKRGRRQMPPFGEDREELVDAGQRPRSATPVGADQQVFLDRKRREQSSSFRDERDPACDDIGGAEPADCLLRRT